MGIFTKGFTISSSMTCLATFSGAVLGFEELPFWDPNLQVEKAGKSEFFMERNLHDRFPPKCS